MSNKTDIFFHLNGQTAIVTGGGGGIGKSTCVLLAQAGARIIVADRDLSSASDTAAEIVAASADGMTLIYSNSPKGEIGFVELVENFGNLASRDDGIVDKKDIGVGIHFGRRDIDNHRLTK